MKYKIASTDKAEDQLREIIFYIADDSGSVDVALSYLKRMEASINRLKDFPRSGNIPKYSALRKQGFLVLIVEKHLVFYKINEVKRNVTIYAVVDGRQEYRNLI